MEITEIKVKIQKIKKKTHPNLLAFATLIFKGNAGEYFAISGFTIWKSKYGGYNVKVPSKPGFKFCLFEESLWRRLKEKIIKAYEYEEIPIINEEKME
jgi:hypothetical protein